MKKLIAIVLVLIGLVLVSGIRGNANTAIDLATNGGVPKDPGASLSQGELVEINQLWEGSAHALADVNCSSCHQDSETKELVVQPTQESCQSCHEVAVETFLYGKHGIRISEGLSPLTPAMAHLPMKESAMDKQMNCNTCHNVHSVQRSRSTTLWAVGAWCHWSSWRVKGRCAKLPEFSFAVGIVLLC